MTSKMTSRGLTSMGLLAVLGVILSPSAVEAQLIHACYVPASGTVYRIKAEGAKDACTGKKHVEFSWNAAGPAGPEGPRGPANTLTEADLVGTWTGDMVTEDGSTFVSVGTRTITFDAGGTYTSDIFSNGGVTQSGSFLVVGGSVVVTHEIGFSIKLGSVVATADSLKFVLNVRPAGGGFSLSTPTVYLLAR